MSPPPDPSARKPLRRRRTWRWVTPLVLAVSGVLFVVSAASSQGTDLRPGRYTSLAGLVGAQSAEVAALRARAADLQAEITRLSGGLGDEAVVEARARARHMEGKAGLRAQAGPGVRVTLSDSPPEVRDVSTQPPNLLVVHQQDIQAVVNALWRGGATAMTIQDQRVVSTTGIKCEGNSVQLHGVPYAQPYVIEAIGDPADLLTALARDDTVRLYREQSQDPTIAIGWDVAVSPRIVAPPYDGLLDVQYARPVR